MSCLLFLYCLLVNILEVVINLIFFVFEIRYEFVNFINISDGLKLWIVCVIMFVIFLFFVFIWYNVLCGLIWLILIWWMW